MKKSKSSNGSKNRFMRILRLPIRVLTRARDLYVRSMTDYADRVGYGDLGYAALPRSFSGRSSGENNDLSQLIRAASAARFGDRIDVDAVIWKRYCDSSTVRVSKVVARNKSLGMDRIDEEEDEDEDEESVKKSNGEGNGGLSSFYPRSRSCVV